MALSQALCQIRHGSEAGVRREGDGAGTSMLATVVSDSLRVAVQKLPKPFFFYCFYHFVFLDIFKVPPLSHATRSLSHILHTQQTFYPANSSTPTTRRLDMLYVRGDGVLLVVPTADA